MRPVNNHLEAMKAATRLQHTVNCNRGCHILWLCLSTLLSVVESFGKAAVILAWKVWAERVHIMRLDAYYSSYED